MRPLIQLERTLIILEHALIQLVRTLIQFKHVQRAHTKSIRKRFVNALVEFIVNTLIELVCALIE